MAKDVRFLIAASAAKAEEEIKRLQRSGQQTASVLQREFDQLGVSSSVAFENKRKAAQSAYDRIKTSGMATQDELARAEKSLADRLVQIDTDQFGKRTGLMEKFKANWLTTTAAIGAAWIAVAQGWDAAKQAAEGLQQRASFENLAASHGFAAKTILSDLERVSAGTIATKDLIQAAGTAMLTGIPADKLARLMEIARASARVTGDSITKSFSDISLAVARQSRMILDNLGIVISEEKAYKEYAATLGKAAEQLTDSEKKQAFMNATLKAGDEIIKRVGVTGETAAEKMQRFEARMKNLRDVVGTGLLAALTASYGVLNMTASAVLYLAGAYFKFGQALYVVTDLLRITSGAADYMKGNADAAFAAAKDLAKKGLGDLSIALDIVTGKVNASSSAMQKMAATTSDTANSTAKYKERAKEIVEIEKERWKTLIDGEKAYAAKLADAIRAKTGELQTLQNGLKSFREQIAEIEKERAGQFGVQLDPNLDAYDRYQTMLQKLQAEEARLAEIADPEARGKATLELIKKHAALTGEVKVGNDIIVTQAEVIERSQEAMDRLRGATETAYRDKIGLLEKEKAALESAHRSAMERAEQYERKIKDLDTMLKNLNGQTVTINFEARGIEQLYKVEALVKNTTRQAGYSEPTPYFKDFGDYYIAQGKTYWADGTLADKGTSFAYDLNAPMGTYGYGSLAVGTRRVSRTGLYQLHEGEEVKTRVEASRGQGDTVVRIDGGISITVQGGDTSGQTIDEIARQLAPRLEEYARRRRAA